jgi:DNA-binding IclR family transcriptional regulator
LRVDSACTTMFLEMNKSFHKSNTTVKTKDRRQSTPAVRRAMQLLEEVSRNSEPLGVSELARRLGLGKSTVHGLVGALVEEGLLATVNGSKRYQLGPRLAWLGRLASSTYQLDAVLQVMTQLARETGETVFYGDVIGSTVRILAREDGSRPLRLSAPVGATVPLFAGALGKAWLASQPQGEWCALLHQIELPRYTEQSIVTPEDYLAEVEATARSGIAVDRGEYIPGVYALCAPLPQPHGTNLLWLVGMEAAVDEETILRHSAALRKAAAFVTSASDVSAPPHSGAESRKRGSKLSMIEEAHRWR